MFNKNRIKKLEKRIEEMDDSYQDYRKNMIKIIERLDAEIFKLKHPNGVVEIGGSARYLYAYDNKIQSVTVLGRYSVFPIIKEYKIVTDNNVTYIAIKNEDSEKLFVVNKWESSVVEITSNKVIEDAEWVAVK